MQLGGAVQLLALEMLGLASLVLALFWFRRRIGLTPLYVTLGVFQPVQVLLSSSIYVDLWPGVPVSPCNNSTRQPAVPSSMISLLGAEIGRWSRSHAHSSPILDSDLARHCRRRCIGKDKDVNA